VDHTRPPGGHIPAQLGGLGTILYPAAVGGSLASLERGQHALRRAALDEADVLDSLPAHLTAALLGTRAQCAPLAASAHAGRPVAFYVGKTLCAPYGEDLPSVTREGTGWSLTGVATPVVAADGARYAVLLAHAADGGRQAVLLDLGEEITDPIVVADRPIPGDALLGGASAGFDVAVTALEVTTVLAAGRHLAAMDVALIRGFEAATGHPDAAWELAAATVESCVLDLLSRTVSRLVALDPASLGMACAILARIATDLSTRQATRIAGVLGPRALLTTAAGADVRRVTISHLTTDLLGGDLLADPRTIALHVGAYARIIDDQGLDIGRTPDPRARVIFDLTAALPDLDLDALAAASAGHHIPTSDPVVTDAPRTLSRILERLDRSGDPDAQVVAALAERVVDQLRDVVVTMGELTGPGDPAALPSPWSERIGLADRFSWLYAAAAALHFFHHSHRAPLFGEPPGSTRWLRGVLGYLLARANAQDPVAAQADIAPMVATGRAATDARQPVCLGSRLLSDTAWPEAGPAETRVPGGGATGGSATGGSATGGSATGGSATEDGATRGGATGVGATGGGG
jgi:hypothetical protein